MNVPITIKSKWNKKAYFFDFTGIEAIKHSNTYPTINPPVGPRIVAIPPENPANTGIPIAPIKT